MHEIEELERRGWDALSGPDGATFYEDLLADDGVMVFPGLTLNKAATVRAIAGERPWSRYDLDEIHVAGDRDAAVITYHATSQREGEDEYRARMSSAYARRDERWRLLLHQQTPDPQRPRP
jgi:uncharacterized protein (TIGR02246 family)